MTIQVKIKGVSDLEKCMDYFSLPGKSCENFPGHITPPRPPEISEKNWST